MLRDLIEHDSLSVMNHQWWAFDFQSSNSSASELLLLKQSVRQSQCCIHLSMTSSLWVIMWRHQTNNRVIKSIYLCQAFKPHLVKVQLRPTRVNRTNPKPGFDQTCNISDHWSLQQEAKPCIQIIKWIIMVFRKWEILILFHRCFQKYEHSLQLEEMQPNHFQHFYPKRVMQSIILNPLKNRLGIVLLRQMYWSNMVLWTEL